MGNPIQTKPLRVGVIGVGACTDQIIRAYDQVADAAVTAVAADDLAAAQAVAAACRVAGVFADYREMLTAGAVDAVEVHAAAGRHREIAAAVCQKGLPLAIHKPLAATGEEARAIVADVRRAGVAALVLDPLLFHPLVREAKALLADERIGEVQMLRLKSHAGRDERGEACDPAVFADPAHNPLILPAFDKAALAEYLLGPIAEVFAYAGPASRMVSFKFTAAGCYGFHEAVCSPGLAVQSVVMPVDHSLEITGTDGILWVRNLTGLMVEAPRLMLKRKCQTTVWDDRVEYEMPAVLAQMRAHFVAVARGREKPGHTLEQAARALAVNEAVADSVRAARPIRLSD
ncbi:MAG: Gfo/Idh/MocA family oxidoreductase [Myxococcales bacterium]|nr:Gfo/Idh/MocA family oxidoreductase [Myxococcales bacterium]